MKLLFLLLLSLNLTAQVIGPAGKGVFYASDFGIFPSGSNQGTNINNMIAAVPDGSTIIFDRSRTYNVATTLALNKGIIFEGNDATIFWNGASGQSIFNITASNVTVRNTNIQGTYGTYVANGYMIKGQGTSNTNRIKNVKIQDCSMTDFNGVAIRFQYVDDFKMQRNYMDSLPYGGINVYSCSESLIEDNEIDHITSLGTTQSNAYGIVASALGSDSLPRSISIILNTIRNIPLWEGIDTHGGRSLIITNNTVLGCANGILVISNATGAPKDCVVSNNYIETYNPNDGSAIRINGASATGDPATGVVEGNIIKGQGIKLDRSNGMIVNGNHITQPSDSYGILFNGSNLNATCSNNTVEDVWGSNNSCVVQFALDSNRVNIYGNTLVSGSFVSPNGLKNRFGLRSSSGVNDEAYVGWNNFLAATSEKFQSTTTQKTRYLTPYGTKNVFITTVTPYSVLQEDLKVFYDYAAGGTTITLPPITALNDGRELYIISSSTGTLTTNLPMYTTGTVNSTTIAAGTKAHLTYDFPAGKIYRD